MTPVAYCVKKELERLDRIRFDQVSSDELFKQEIEFAFRGREVSIVRRHETQDQLRVNFFFQMLNAVKDLPELNFNVIVNFDDDVPRCNPFAPRLSFSRREGDYNILIPDPHILNAANIALQIKPIDIPFKQKMGSAVFAGSDTGLSKSAHENQRFQFCYKNCDNPLGYFKITQFVEIDKFGTDTLSEYDINKVKSEYIPIPQQLHHRYIMNINGNTTCWDRLLWAMSSNSLCLFLRPPAAQLSWYYHYLQKENAFYYVNDDDWSDKVKYFNAHIAQAEDMVSYQQQFSAPFLNLENHLLYFRQILLYYNEKFQNG